jgi:hypothetical protein
METTDDSRNERIPRKRQARLDDNGEPAGVPAPKKIKSADKNGQKKKSPAKAQQEKKKTPSVPLKKTPSIEIPASNPTTPPTTPPEPKVVVVSSDDEDIAEILEAPEEDAEAQLGAYSVSVFK